MMALASTKVICVQMTYRSSTCTPAAA
eukprot:COSAG03_NODE_21726_length_300_cov_0.875622_1_plen_26_part_10